MGVSHDTAPIAVRERFAFPPGTARSLLEEADEEALLLVTCNRTELYGLADPGELARRLVDAAGVEDDRPVFRHGGEEAARHLFEVASGLDSMIVGEPQILGQVKRAMAEARDAGSLGPVLDELARRALQVGRSVRHRTGVGEGLPSIPKVATGLARLVLGDLEGHTVLVVGTGELGRLTAGQLREAGVSRIVVTNRSPEPAEQLADRIGGVAAPFERLDELMVEADVALTCTAAQEPFLSRERVEAVVAGRDGRKLVLIDIAVPRDVDAGVRAVEGARLYDLDDLRGWGSDAVDPEAVEAARAIVDREAADFARWRASRSAVPAIRALHAKAGDILHRELERVSPEDAERMLRFGRRILRKILHDPVVGLREGVAREGEEYLESARELLGLDGEPPAEAKGLERVDPREDSG
ncbi:MAG: glutamyl-tRNA reductase [Gemmatimonadota bacterium]|nr:glutamyl-tRNA reductase [Gemmatimonadota bacterium]